jgi:predicted enzyme related to lactoylglutathione lyase
VCALATFIAQTSVDRMAKGHAGTVLLTSDDVEATYKQLSTRGVEFVEPPEGRPYGIDSAFRDPSGNFLRLIQLREPEGQRRPGPRLS